MPDSIFLEDERPYHARSGGYEASQVVTRGECTLYRISGFNSNAKPQFIQVHDAREVPPDGATPLLVIAVEASSEFTIECGERGQRFNSGIVVCNSSTSATKTAGAADCWFDAVYEE